VRDPALAAGCAALEIDLDAGGLEVLSAYLDLLQHWNRAYNLTAVRDRDRMVTRHLLDSLSILHRLEGSAFLDVGSGAGLPGIPLAIARPDWELHLLDSNGKKTRFLFQVKTQLALANIRVVSGRAESFEPGCRYHGVLSRAFASLPAFIDSCGHLAGEGGALYAMKGSVPDAEVAAAAARGYRVSVDPLSVPGLAEQRTLITLRREERP
jgi:16S rRNA (guanine527-N7)-methyltransferase